MNSISLIYRDLNFEALVKIFQLADILGVTPHVAAETYIKFRAQSQTKPKNEAS